jgi:hypothetical protein
MSAFEGKADTLKRTGAVFGDRHPEYIFPRQKIFSYGRPLSLGRQSARPAAVVSRRGRQNKLEPPSRFDSALAKLVALPVRLGALIASGACLVALALDQRTSGRLAPVAPAVDRKGNHSRGERSSRSLPSPAKAGSNNHWRTATLGAVAGQHQRPCCRTTG